MIVNPNNVVPTISVIEGLVTYRYYDQDVSSNVPLFLRAFAVIEVIILIYALYNIWIPEEDQ
jgi:hypothetical protein